MPALSLPRQTLSLTNTKYLTNMNALYVEATGYKSSSLTNKAYQKQEIQASFDKAEGTDPTLPVGLESKKPQAQPANLPVVFNSEKRPSSSKFNQDHEDLNRSLRLDRLRRSMSKKATLMPGQSKVADMPLIDTAKSRLRARLNHHHSMVQHASSASKKEDVWRRSLKADPREAFVRYHRHAMATYIDRISNLNSLETRILRKLCKKYEKSDQRSKKKSFL